ncbi:MAG: MFS transporter [Alphaproteobacteria bacterium]|nr:MFS transporter [Alphaproteobacteria bacterium]
MAVFDAQNRRWWILGAMSGVLGLTVLDETIVGVALPTIRPDLDMGQVASHWVVNAYLLTFTCFVAIGGRLGDSHGHTGIFVIGTAIFAAASLAAGSAPSGGWLIGARAAQGMGAAIIFPASLAMITSIFPAEERGTAFGIQVTIAAVFMSMGPLVGGFFTETISWRWIFWINLPFVAVIALIIFVTRERALEPSAPTAPTKAESHGFDIAGLATLVLGLTALVVAFMQGVEWGWDSPAILSLLAGGVVLLGIFAVVELHRANPLIEISLLRIATFTGGNLVFFMFQFNKIAIFVFVALYLQEVMRDSPIEAGLVILVSVLPTLVTSLLAGKAADRFGSRMPLSVGLFLNASAVGLVADATASDSYALIVAPLIVWGATLPVVAVCSRRALMSAVPEAQRGQAGGVNLTIQMLGGTIGMALCGTLLATTGDYGLVFGVTSGLLFVSLLIAMTMIERSGASAAAH